MNDHALILQTRMVRLYAALGMSHTLLAPLAGPYRVIVWKPFTPGLIDGFLTWLGVIAVYPLLATSADGLWGRLLFWLSWAGLIALTYRRMNGSEVSEAAVWDGRFRHWEPAVAMGLCLAMSACFGIGLGWFLAAGFAASVMQAGIARLRSRCLSWTPEDTERLKGSLITSTQGVASAAASGKGWLWFGIRTGAMSVFPFFAMLLRGTGWMFSKRKSEGDAQRPPSFMNRVFCHIIASLLLSFITGVIKFTTVIRWCAYILAIPLALLGWHVDPPSAEKENPHGILHKVKEMYVHTKEKVTDKVEDIKEKRAESRRRRLAIFNARMYPKSKGQPPQPEAETPGDETATVAAAESVPLPVAEEPGRGWMIWLLASLVAGGGYVVFKRPDFARAAVARFRM